MLPRDAEVFRMLLADLFPGTLLKAGGTDPDLQAALEVVLERRLLERNDKLEDKVGMLRTTMEFRSGVMLIGRTFSGKSTVLETLRDCNLLLAEEEKAQFRNLNRTVINPKCLSIE